jgi:glycine cleavage system transcriptional repressor
MNCPPPEGEDLLQMRTDIVLTLTGPDRVGIVQEVTGVLLGFGGNVGTSSMARLGGEFAMLMLVSVPADTVAGLSAAFDGLAAQGYEIRISPAAAAESVAPTSAEVFRIDLRGADHEGIVHEIARGLARLGINIESMETGVTRAPMTGAPLFWLTALVAVPADVADLKWKTEIRDAGRAAGVDVTITSIEEG